MKLKLTLRVFVIFFVIFAIAQFVYTLRFTDAYSIADAHIKSTFINNLMILVVLQFFLGVSLFLFIPKFISRMLSGISRIIKDIAVGKFNTEIVVPNTEKEITKIYENLRIMYNELEEYDELKRSKVLEQKSRFDALYSIASDAFLIVDLQGVVISLSHQIREHFPEIDEGTNLVNATFGSSTQKLKEYVTGVVECKEAIEPTFYNMKKLELHFGLKSAVIRSQTLEILGYVVAVSVKNSAKKKEKKGEQ